VVQYSNDNGLGERGDMKAVIKAILLDYEPEQFDDQRTHYGKQRTAAAGDGAGTAFPAPPTVQMAPTAKAETARSRYDSQSAPAQQ